MTVEENITSPTQKSVPDTCCVLRDVRSIRRDFEKVCSRLKKLERDVEKLVMTHAPRRRPSLDSVVDALNRKRDSMGKALAIQMLCRRQTTAAEMYLLMPCWWTKDKVGVNAMRNVVCDANTLLREKQMDGEIKAVNRGRFKWRSIGALAQYAEKINRELSRARALIGKSPLKAKGNLSALTKRHPGYLEALLSLAECLTVTEQTDSELPMLHHVKSLLSSHEQNFSRALVSLAKRLTDDPKNPLWEGASEVIRALETRLEQARGAIKTLAGIIRRIEEADPKAEEVSSFLEKVEALQGIQGESAQNREEEYEKALANLTQSAFFSENIQPMLEQLLPDYMNDLQRRSLVAEVLIKTKDLSRCSTVAKLTKTFNDALRERLSEEIARITAGIEREDFRLASELEMARQHMDRIGVEPSRDKILKDLGWDESKFEKAEKAWMWLRQRVRLEEERDAPEE